MATEAGFAEQLQATPATPQNTRGGGKRKRNATDNANSARPSPMSRRGNQNQQTEQTDAITANNFNFLRNQDGDIGIPDVAQNNTQEEADNVDTAAAALNYSMQQAPEYSNDAGNQNNSGQGEETNFDDSMVAGNTTEPEGEQGEFPESPSNMNKPAVGSAEWTRQRKDNHKEVERRRRETINEGINTLSKMIPNCEKNKGTILARAVQYINQLRDEATQNIDKWTFEKLVTDQAIRDLSEKLERIWAQAEAWKKASKEAGVDVDNYDLGIPGGEEETEKAGPSKRSGKGKAKAAPAPAPAPAPTAQTVDIDQDDA